MIEANLFFQKKAFIYLFLLFKNYKHDVLYKKINLGSAILHATNDMECGMWGDV
jgi:hypothetical protein